MQRLLTYGIKAIALCGLVLAGPPAWASDTSAPNTKAISAAANAAQGGDCKTTLRLVAPWLASSAALANDQRTELTDLAVWCALNTSQAELAYAYSLQGTRYPNASDWLWRTRLAIELEGKHTADALMTVAAMTHGRGAALNGVPVRSMYALDNAFRDAGDTAARRRLLTILIDPVYQPDEVLSVADVFCRRYAELLYDAGDKQASLDIIRQINTPALIMALSVDPRFPTAVPATYDARTSITAYLEKLKAVAVHHVDSLELVIEIASIERQLGRPDRALATLQAGDPNKADAPAYADKDKQLNWWWDGVARAYQANGNYAETVAAMRRGANLREDGGINVSQTINLAEAQLRYGHPADVLETLKAFDTPGTPISPYGEMEMRFTRGCAAKLAGKGDPVNDLAFAKAHDHDHPQALSDLLLCIGDLDGAAATFVDRLDDPARRVGALLELSSYEQPSRAVPSDPVYSRIEALTVRDDLKAAIARAGGTRQFNVQRQDL